MSPLTKRSEKSVYSSKGYKGGGDLLDFLLRSRSHGILSDTLMWKWEEANACNINKPIFLLPLTQTVFLFPTNPREHLGDTALKPA